MFFWLTLIAWAFMVWLLGSFLGFPEGFSSEWWTRWITGLLFASMITLILAILTTRRKDNS